MHAHTCAHARTNTRMHTHRAPTHLKPLPLLRWVAWHVAVPVAWAVHARGAHLPAPLNLVAEHDSVAEELGVKGG